MKQNKIITTIAILFLLCKIGISQPELIDKVEAVVGDKIILYSDIMQQKLQAESQGVKTATGFDCGLLEQMLFQKLLLHQAEIDSVEIPEEQIQAQLDNRINYFISLIGSVDELEKFYGKPIAVIKDEFHDMVSDNMKAETMQSNITEGITVTPGDVKEFFNKIPTDSLPYVNSKVVVKQIVIIPEVSQEEKDAIYTKMMGIKNDIIAGTRDFCVTAVLESADDVSASNCGKLGWQDKNNFVPEFAAMAMSLKEGDISDPFWSEYGCHIMRLIERRGTQINVQHILIRPKIGSAKLEESRIKLENVKNLIEKDSIFFRDAVLKYSNDENTKNSGGIIVDNNTGMSTIDVGNIEGKLGQQIDRLKVGEVSPAVPFEAPDGSKGYRLLFLVSRTTPHVANLSDDYQLFKDAALQSKKGDIVDTWINKKITMTYIKINDDYLNCSFAYNWISKEN